MLKVLVVEDDSAVAALVRTLLEEGGYGASITVDIEGAEDVLRVEAPDVMIVDLGLPRGQSGWDLVEAVRASERYRDLPIVILTGQSPENVIDRAQQLGCEYLQKPFSPPALIDRVQLAVRSAGKGPTQRAAEVVLLFKGYRLEGTVHIPQELRRFSDAWEAIVRDPREYIPVTNARLMEGSSSEQVDFIQVRKADITAAFARDTTD